MRTIKGPGLFLAQFMGAAAPFDSLANIAPWVAALGYAGVQVPANDARCIDLARAAESDAYCDEIKGLLAGHGLVITELSTHIQGQLVAVHPAYRDLFAGFLPPALRTASAAEQQRWAAEQVILGARASRRLGLSAMATFSGALLWHTVYPWPQRPAGLVEEGFAELARRWRPILDACADHGIDLCYELHPGEDLHDGVTFERFLAAVDHHPRAAILYDPSHLHLQQMDYVGFLDVYHDRVRMMHVKDAEFRPSPRSGVYGGYQGWVDRPGRFRSLGDGQIDFGAIFSRLAQYDFLGWAVVEWECALKDSTVGAREGADFVKRHIIPVTTQAFDDFVGSGGVDRARNWALLGLD